MRELVKLITTIAVMMAVLAVSAAARNGIDTADRPGTADVAYEVSATC